MIEFPVAGVPQPAGSKRAFPRKGGGVIVTDANPRVRDWRALVQDAALKAMAGREPLEGPLALSVEFTFARPKTHEGVRGLNAVGRRTPYPIVRPDVTKLLRGLEDSLTGVVWRDDAQVVWQLARKVYGARPGTIVRVQRP